MAAIAADELFIPTCFIRTRGNGNDKCLIAGRYWKNNSQRTVGPTENAIIKINRIHNAYIPADLKWMSHIKYWKKRL